MSDTTAMIQATTTAMAPGETAAAAQAAQAQAIVLASYTMAERHPRNLMDVRVKLLADCDRPGFAERARYELPFGRERASGWSIRFAEACVRLLGNLAVHTPVTFDDSERQIVQVMVMDLEANNTYTKDVTVDKVVEKRSLRRGQKPIGARVNSYGDTVHLVRATEQETARKMGAEVSKAIRTCVLRMVPADILEECEEAVAATLSKRDRSDPDAATKRIVDGFAKLGIQPSQLETLLGHGLASIHTDELAKLRGYYGVLTDGMATWPEIMECENPQAAAAEGEEDPHAELRAKVQERLHKTKGGAKKRQGKPKARKSQPKAEAYDGPPEDVEGGQ